MDEYLGLPSRRGWQDRFIPERFQSGGDNVFRSRLYVTLFAFSSLLHLLYILTFVYGLQQSLVPLTAMLGQSMTDWIAIEIIVIALYYAMVAVLFGRLRSFDLAVNLLLVGIYVPIVFGALVRLLVFDELSYAILPLVVVAYNLGGKSMGLRWIIITVMVQVCFMWLYFTRPEFMGLQPEPVHRAVFASLIEAVFVWSVIIASSLSYEDDISFLQVKLQDDRRHYHHRAHHDPLTGLPNSSHFQAVFQRLAEAGQQFAVVYIDLDNFKQINDSHSHAVGDRVLCEISDRLRNSVRADDVCARLGGDEFALLMVGQVGEEEVKARLDALKRRIGQLVRVDDVIVRPEASLGFALYPLHSQDYQSLMHRADLSMYQEKQRRNAAPA